MSRSIWVLAVLFLAAVPSAAGAQGSAFGSLADRLKTGDTVFVTQGGVETKGKVVDVSPTSLVLAVNGKPATFTGTGVTRVARQRSAAKKGALFGMIGFGVLGYIQGPGDSIGPGESEAQLRVGVAVGEALLFGAPVGAVVGRFIKHRETLYDSTGAGRSAVIGVAPLVGHSRKGISLAVVF